MRQYHLDLDESDVGRYVLMPGDPHRVSAIAAYLSDAREMSFHREFCTWTGYLGQTRVSVVSSGIGGPSTAIALEELAALGVHTVIRTGTCGLLQPSDTRGTLVIATGCYRGGSTANAYVPLNYPAIADFELVEALCTAARSRRASVLSKAKMLFFSNRPNICPASKKRRCTGISCSAQEYWQPKWRAIRFSSSLSFEKCAPLRSYSGSVRITASKI